MNYQNILKLPCNPYKAKLDLKACDQCKTIEFRIHGIHPAKCGTESCNALDMRDATPAEQNHAQYFIMHHHNANQVIEANKWHRFGV